MAQQWTEQLGSARLREPWGVAMFGEVSPEDLEHAPKRLRIVGILALIAGALAILIPAVATVTIAILTGWLLVFVGAAMLGHEIRMRRRRRWLDVLTAALTILAGVCLLVFPLTGALTLTFFLCAWFFTTGTLQLVAWWRLRGSPGAVMLGLNGITSLILGLLIALSLPSSAAWAIGLLVGVNLVFFGVRALMAASALKQLLPQT